MELVSLRDEDGAELWDLPGAPRPDAGTPAPVRLLPQFDNVLLAHADRSRILRNVDLAQLFQTYRVVPGTILVDGYVAGVWSVVRARRSVTVRAEPLQGDFSSRARAAIVDESERLLDSMGVCQGRVEIGSSA